MEPEIHTVGEVESSKEDVAELLRKIGKADASALLTLYDRTSRLLFGIILRILGDRTPAEEALLDVYTRIWKRAEHYDPALFTPVEWLINVARTSAIVRVNWGKQEGQKRRLPAVSGNQAVTVAPEQQKMARDSIASLVPAQREILEWAFYSGLSCSEIAAQTGKPLGAVKTHARLGLGKLSDLWGANSGPEAGAQLGGK